MNFIEFYHAIDNLVKEWAGKKPLCAPRDELKTIWSKVREQAVHEMAVEQQRRTHADEKTLESIPSGPSCGEGGYDS